MACRKHELMDWDAVYDKYIVRPQDPMTCATIGTRIGMSSRAVSAAFLDIERVRGISRDEARAMRRAELAAIAFADAEERNRKYGIRSATSATY